MKTVDWLGVFSWFPKEDVTWSRGYIGVWSVTITHVYPTDARVKGR
jgi:hypothetical protein